MCYLMNMVFCSLCFLIFEAALLDGVANTALVELGEIELVAHLAEKKPTGQPFFRNGMS